GRVGAVFELGKEFQPELSGRENAVLSGVISGLTRRRVIELLPEIVAFAELEAFIDSPLRVYSSGMKARLAFAVASCLEPDVLLLDEILAVGDAAFQERCIARIDAFRSAGVTDRKSTRLNSSHSQISYAVF